MWIVVTVIVLVGVFVDLISCFLFIMINKKGYGPSGVPMVTLIAFYLLPMMLSGEKIFDIPLWGNIIIFVIFHFIFVFVIPIFHGVITEKNGKCTNDD